MSSGLEISVVVPVYNNSATLKELSARLISVLHKCAPTYEILYVNDGSKDNSFSILQELTGALSQIKVINLSKNFGQHPAICAGFEHASGEFIVLMDADLQDRPEDIIKLIKKIRQRESDVIYTIKKSLDRKVTSRFTSAIYHYAFAKIVNAKVPRNIGTFRIFNRKFLLALLQYKEANVLYGPLMFFMGFKSDFIELEYNDRLYGKSSYTFNKRLQLAVNSLISYTDIPHKISALVGLLLLFGALVYGLIVLVQYLLFGATFPGGTTLVLLVLCLTLGSVMMSLGIIGSYLFRVYQEVLGRPRYLVQDKINF